jgi:zinc D-Ala-D-Ala carboxypeptidase
MLTVRRGSRNGDVKALQELLNQLGYDCGSADGIFGVKTEKAVKQFQKTFLLSQDGIAGPKTFDVLQRLEKIKHFKHKEFACRHCGEIKVDINLLEKLEQLRTAIGNRPIYINSGYRCPTHNRNVGGAKNSQHMYGKAADIRAKDMSPRTLEKFADTIFANGGVGMGGQNIVHVDTRGHKARWYY